MRFVLICSLLVLPTLARPRSGRDEDSAWNGWDSDDDDNWSDRRGIILRVF